MAAVVHALWVNGDERPLILPASIPLDDQDVFEEVTRHLEDNWKPVVDTDIDGQGSCRAPSTGTTRPWTTPGNAARRPDRFHGLRPNA